MAMPLRADSVTLRAAVRRSIAISVPELPMPTTSASCPAKGVASTYSLEWMTRPRYWSRPGRGGVCGLLPMPVAATSTGASQTRSAVWTRQPAPPRSARVTGALSVTERLKRRA